MRRERAVPARVRTREDLMVKGSRGLVYLGLAFLPLLKFRAGHLFDLSDAMLLVASGLLLLSRRPPPRAPKVSGWYFGAFIFVLAGVVASSQALAKFSSLVVVLNAIILFFLFAWTLRQLLDTKTRMQIAMGAFIVGTTASAFVAFLQITFHAFGYENAAGIEGSRAIGLSTQPNLAAVSFDLALIFAIGLVLELGLRKFWYLGACGAMIAVALLFSASVSGMATAVVGCLILFFRRGVRLRTIVAIVVALGVVYFLGTSLESGGLNPIARIEATTGSNTGYNTVGPREETIILSWNGIVQSPIVGHGLDQETLAVYFDPYVPAYYPAHDVIILYWYGGGIFLLAGGAIMVLSAMRRLVLYRDALSDIVLVGCIVVLVYAMQAPALVDRWLWFPFLLALCFRPPNWGTNGNGTAHASVSVRNGLLPGVDDEFATQNGNGNGNGGERSTVPSVSPTTSASDAHRGRHAAREPAGTDDPVS